MIRSHAVILKAVLSIVFAVMITFGNAPAHADSDSESGSIDRLAWMSGHWAGDENGRWTEEHWLEPRGGLMLGVNRSGNADVARAFEFLRIQASGDGSIVYWASPGGRPATPFALIEQSDRSAKFENTENDFPSLLHYERQGDSLLVTASDASGNRILRWLWRLQ